jgi:parallel beta-helix repeat protein
MAPSGRHVFGYELWTTDNYQTPGDNNPAKCSGGCPPENPNYYSIFTGTSAASPAIAGIAALIKSHMPGLTPAQVRQRLIDSAVDLGDVGPDSLYGYGRVDAYRALTEWGTIAGNVTWRPEDTADSTRYVSGDLTIAPGATLTIMPGTIVRIANDDDLKTGADTARVEINVQGTIVADGTVANPVVFESWHPLTTSDWVGIQLDSTSSGGTFDNCFISRAEVGVDSRASLTMTHTVIDRCAYACVSSREGGASIHDCQFTRPGDFGIEVHADSVDIRDTTVDGAVISAITGATGAKLMVVDCTAVNSNVAIDSYASLALVSTVIDSCSYAGVLSREGGASIDGCEITHPGDFGIEIESDSVYVRDTTVDGALTGAISAQADARLVVRNCTVTNSYVAVDSYAPLTMVSTVIDSCSYAGVLSRSGGAWIQDCGLRAPGSIGIEVLDDAAIVRGTTVDGAVGKALSAQAGASLQVRGSIFKNSDTGLDINGAATVDVDSTCFFYSNDVGIHLYQAGALATIRSSGITWNTSCAILCDASSHPHIISNIFAHNGAGIYCKNSSSPTIEWNQIQSAGYAITAESYSAPDVGHTSHPGSESSGNNKIAHAAKYVANYTASEIFAQHNCWNINFGTCTPASSKFIGSVDYSDAQCCNFPVFAHGVGEPAPVDGFVFQAEPAPAAPKERITTALVAIVPNPFNPTTTIQYSLASQGRVEIDVYDVAGRLVERLARETQVAGKHAVVWEGKDRKGSPVASGVYFVRMSAAGQLFTRKMVLLK